MILAIITSKGPSEANDDASPWNTLMLLIFDFYKWLIETRHENPALAAGGKGGKFEVVSTDDSTLVFTRTLPDNKVTVKVQLKAPWGYEIIAE